MSKIERSTAIRCAAMASTSYLVLAVIFSLGLNLLFLASPLYMMQVYDRVLASGSAATLALLTAALATALITLSLLDDARTKLLSRLGARLDAQLAGVIFAAQFRAMRAGKPALAGQAMRDFDTLRSFISGNGLHGFFDLPWLPVYVAALYGADTSRDMVGGTRPRQGRKHSCVGSFGYGAVGDQVPETFPAIDHAGAWSLARDRKAAYAWCDVCWYIAARSRVVTCRAGGRCVEAPRSSSGSLRDRSEDSPRFSRAASHDATASAVRACIGPAPLTCGASSRKSSNQWRGIFA